MLTINIRKTKISRNRKKKAGKVTTQKMIKRTRLREKTKNQKNNNVSVKTDKAAFNKGFSTHRNLAVVKAENRTEQSDEDKEGEEKSPKLAVIRANRQKPNKRENKNKIERDRVNEKRFAKLKINVEEDMKSESATKNKGKQNRDGKL